MSDLPLSHTDANKLPVENLNQKSTLISAQANPLPAPIDRQALEQKARQKKILLILTGIFLLIALAYGLYWLVYLRFFESTDDAYINGNIVSVTSQVTGNITAIHAEDTTFVNQGSVLVEIDKTDSKAAFIKAQAALASTVRQTAQYFINDLGLQAAIAAKKATLDQAHIDLQRRKNAINVGGVSKEELSHAQDSYTLADSALTQAQAAWQANHVLIAQITLRQHPAIQQAVANLKQAFFDLKRTTINAPVSGYVVKRAAQVGQRINASTMLMAIVPPEQLWIDANFKEKQLRAMHPGQPVIATADMYGKTIVYHGTVVGFSGGTGSAFALLPAQNATGNWIKVVQRLPVRIALDPKELSRYPLKIGLSMQVTVDISHQKRLSAVNYHPRYQTSVFNSLNNQADHRAERLLTQYLKQVDVAPIQQSEH